MLHEHIYPPGSPHRVYGGGVVRDIYTDPREGDRVQFTIKGDSRHQDPVIVTQVNERGVSFVRPAEGRFSFASWDIWQCKKYKAQALLAGPMKAIKGVRHA